MWQLARLVSSAPRTADARLTQPRRNRHRQKRAAVLLPLATPDDDLPPVEIDVLDPQFEALGDAEPRAIQQHHHQPRSPGEPVQNPPHFSTRQHHWQTLGDTPARNAVERANIQPQDLPIQEEDCAQRLILRLKSRNITRRRRP